ncbi:hypothetical protein CXB51_018328 [Gossypium anomalum]|uniref:Retrotransposon gag domain-containing protein n=1 Tax=Gossypium anomalum TaxID=47600 RepID=A0A8J5YSE0_9ROSI|nr:hypothetical protein CXB51_018328 [Gossypium anomalum]
MKETLELVEGHTDGFDSMEEQLRDFVLDSLGANAEKLNDLVNSTTEKLAERDENLEEMVLAMKKEIEELKGELMIYKVALSNGMLSSKPKQQAMDVPKPEKFKGARSARDVDNFLWKMEQYFRAMSIEDDAIKVNTDSIYFTDVALLWWRRRSTDEKCGGNAIGTWEEFQKELRNQFYPQYAEKEARAKLHRLTQQGTVREYVWAFSELMLQISDLSEKEAFYWFEDGLKLWAKHELRRQGITELIIAMAEAESFVELGPTKDKFESSQPNGKGNGESNHEEDEERHSDDGHSTDSTSGNGKPRDAKRRTDSSSGNERPRDAKRRSNNPRDKGKKIKCFLCQGPHMLRKCPKRSMMSAIQKDEPKEEAKPIEGKPSRVNSMVLIPKKRNDRGGLMFVDINIAGQKQSALIDTGASDLFISEKAAKKLAHNVELQIGEWKGNEDFEVIQLDDYDYILGLNLLDRIKTVLFPWADEIHIITGPLSKIVVPVHRDMKVGTKDATKAPSEKLVERESDMRPVESTVELPPSKKVDRASDFVGKEAMQKQSKRVNAVSKVYCKHSDSVLNSDLLAWQDRRGPFKVRKQEGRGTVGGTKPRCMNRGDSNGIKPELGQVKVETSCQRNVPTSATVQVKRRRKLTQRFRRKGQPDCKASREEAKATTEFQDESSQYNSEVATRALREWVEENVTGQSSKPVTMAQAAPHGGRSIRWGSFSPRELAQFQELLEKPVRLKPGFFWHKHFRYTNWCLGGVLEESSLWVEKADLGGFGRANCLRPHGLRDERSSPVTLGHSFTTQEVSVLSLSHDLPVTTAPNQTSLQPFKDLWIDVSSRFIVVEI